MDMILNKQGIQNSFHLGIVVLLLNIQKLR
jgi:hypothetical protein